MDIGHPLRISLAEGSLEVRWLNLLALSLAENSQRRMFPILAQMMRPMRQPVVVADQLAVKFLGFFNRFTPLPLIFAEPGFDPEITLDQVLPRMPFGIHLMKDAESFIDTDPIVISELPAMVRNYFCP
jgi:hypothetical protein